jgi:hypothetical protein
VTVTIAGPNGTMAQIFGAVTMGGTGAPAPVQTGPLMVLPTPAPRTTKGSHAPHPVAQRPQTSVSKAKPTHPAGPASHVATARANAAARLAVARAARVHAVKKA